MDIVLCIDGTVSMSACIDNIKRNIDRFFYGILNRSLEENSRIGSLRVKVIVFRDYLYDGSDAMQESLFFELPKEKDEFDGFLESIEAEGGGDPCENGLEAIYLAMMSDFQTEARGRQVIVLISDADALELKNREPVAAYPTDMVDEDGLIRLWSGVDRDGACRLVQGRKRMILFAPEYSKYQEMAEKLDRCFFEPMEHAAAFFGDGEVDALAERFFRYVFF